jgi:hypothetical protein
MDLFKTRDDVDEYNDLLAEVQQLRAIIGDQQILLDEHRMDNQHAHEEGGNAERAAVVAWLQRMARNARHWGGDDNIRAEIYDSLVDVFECGEHRREETK